MSASVAICDVRFGDAYNATSYSPYLQSGRYLPSVATTRRKTCHLQRAEAGDHETQFTCQHLRHCIGHGLPYFFISDQPMHMPCHTVLRDCPRGKLKSVVKCCVQECRSPTYINLILRWRACRWCLNMIYHKSMLTGWTMPQRLAKPGLSNALYAT